MSDAQLLAAAAGGDRQAFAQVLDEHYERIYHFAFRWCGNETDAEDITQQACIKLANSIHQFRGEAAFTSWLYRLVVNCAKDWQKSHARHQGDAMPELEPALHDSGSRGILLQQVLQAIAVMGEGFKETALLVLAEGFSHREAGELLGVKESTISWRLHEMRRQLTNLEQEGRYE